MNPKLISYSFGLCSLLWSATVPVKRLWRRAAGHPSPLYSVQGGGPASPQGGPVSYASVSQLNGLLAQLEATSKTTQSDLIKVAHRALED